LECPTPLCDSRTQLKEELARDGGDFCATTDGWTSTAQDGFQAMTIHYLTPEFKLRSHVLGATPFPGTYRLLCKAPW